RDPEPQLVAESSRARLHEFAHGAEHSAGRENRQPVAAHQAQREECPGPPHRSGEPGMVDDVGKCEEMHEPRESEIGLAAVEYVAHILPQPRRIAEGIGAHYRGDRHDSEASGEEPRVVCDTAALKSPSCENADGEDELPGDGVQPPGSRNGPAWQIERETASCRIDPGPGCDHHPTLSAPQPL